MRILILLILAKGITNFSTAQESPWKAFGKITMEEMNLSSCPYDSSASAMILFDRGDAEMNVDRGSSFKRHVRIKILKKDAANKWATDVVYYDKADQFFGKFKASTYNLVDGKIVETKIGEEGLFKDKFDKYTSQAKFTLPQVNEGSVIEYTYTISSNELYGLPDWQFQYDIPVLWSEYNTSIPTYFTFRKDWQGWLHPTIAESKANGDQERVVIANVPAFKPEPFMSNRSNYLSKLRLYVSEIWVPGQSITKVIKSWGSIANGIYESTLYTQIKGSGYLKKIVEEQTAGITEPEKKVQVLYDYVKKNIAWDETTDVIPDHQFKEVLEKKRGTSSEINALLISLLRKAEIDAYPLVLRTREKGFIKPFLPVFSQFNDVICCVKIGDKAMLIDATNAGLSMTSLPERCLNGEGMLVMGRDENEWVKLTTAKARKVITTEWTLAEEGSLSGKLTAAYDGIFGNDMREEFKEKGQEDYVKAMSEGKAWDISKSTFENIDDYKNSAKEIYELEISGFAQAAGGTIYLNPIAHERMEENIFKPETRSYPVDYGAPFDKIYMSKIKIPEGYVPEEIPKPKIFMLPNNAGKYTYNITVMGNTLNVVSQFIINKSSFSVEEYPNLREFYTQVIAKQSEQIVLKKK